VISTIKNHVQSKPDLWIISLSAVMLTVWTLLLYQISSHFDYSIPLNQKPILQFFLLYLAGGFIYLGLLYFIYHIKSNHIHILFIICTGLLLRLILTFSTPILEDDFYRYLWDGAVTANGINPYLYPPESILESNIDTTQIPARLQELGGEAAPILERINHPYVRTIYPAITQLFFALAYLIKPWSLISWKFVLFGVDLCFLFLLAKILLTLGIPMSRMIIYWWNPLLLKEVYNSAHMDILIFPFLFFSLLAIIQKRFIWSAGSLGLAAGVKIWPALLFPILFKPLRKKPVLLLVSAIVFVIILIILFWPVQPWNQLPSSAFFNYSTRWELNDSIFRILSWLFQTVLPWINIHQGYGHLSARLMVFTISLLSVILLTRKRNNDPLSLVQCCIVLIAVIFLISPTQFPWYALWFLPFLVIQPRHSLLLLTPLLSIYYLRYYLEIYQATSIFDNYLVWLQYIPVWILIYREWSRGEWKIMASDEMSDSL
jgi:hypothetical protein